MIFSIKVLRVSCVFASIIFCFSAAQAQFQVSGKVFDHHGDPLSFATVLVLNQEDSLLEEGGISTADGQFAINVDKSGKYLLSVSSVGYEPKIATSFDLGPSSPEFTNAEVQLDEQVETLSEVTIQAEKPLFEQQIDRTVINVQRYITMAGGTALDVLMRSPGVTVNQVNNSIALSGKEGVRVMINGKISRLPMEAIVQMLAGMNAQNIEKIELITTPPAKYEAEGDAGMINIVLKKGISEGFNGSVNGFVGYGRRIKYGTNLNLNYRNKGINFYGDYSYSDRFTTQYFNSERYVQIEGNETFVDTNNERDALTRVHNSNFGLDVDLSKGTTLSLFGSYMDREWDMDALATIQSDTNNIPGNSVRMGTIEVNHSDMWLVSAGISQQLGTSHSLSLNVDYIGYDSNNPTDYDSRYYDTGETLIDQIELKSSKVTPINTWVGKMDYSGTLGGSIRLEAGGKVSLSTLKNDIVVEEEVDGSFTTDEFLSSDAQMTDDIYAGYVSSSFSFGETTEMQAGVRYEHTLTNLDTRAEANLIDRNFGKWFPSLFLQQKISDINSFVLSYSRRITRPSFLQLAPFVLFTDPYSFFQGNEKLLPAFTDQFKAELRLNTLLLSLQFSNDENAISVFQPRVNEENKTVGSAENLDFRRNYGVSASIPFGLMDWWEVQLNAVGQYVIMEASFLETPIRAEIYNFNFNGNSRFSLSKGWTIELSGYFQSPSVLGIYRTRALSSVNVGVEKAFNHGNLRLSFNDIFMGSNYRWEANVPEENIRNYALLDFEPRQVTLSYTWNFGNGKQGKRKTIASEEEQIRYQ